MDATHTQLTAAQEETPRDGAPAPVQTVHDDGIRLRHPLEIRLYRPARTSRWSPNRDRRDAGCSHAKRRTGFLSPTLVAAPHLGTVRINFRYGGWVPASAMHSDKAQRDQYFEGSNEGWGGRVHEIDPDTLDLQYQPITLFYHAIDGVLRRIVLDFAIETAGGAIIFGEDKASKAYFEEPETYERLDFAERFLGTLGVGFERRVAGGTRSELHRLVVKDIFDNRRTEYQDFEAARIRALVQSAGGVAPLGEVLRSLDHPVDTALTMIHAVMGQRLVAVPMDLPPMPDTPVTIPKIAKKGALRAFLKKHVPDPVAGEES